MNPHVQALKEAEAITEDTYHLFKYRAHTNEIHCGCMVGYHAHIKILIFELLLSRDKSLAKALVEAVPEKKLKNRSEGGCCYQVDADTWNSARSALLSTLRERGINLE